MAPAGFIDGRLESARRSDGSKDGKPVVPTIDDMAKRSAELNSQSSCHLTRQRILDAKLQTGLPPKLGYSDRNAANIERPDPIGSAGPDGS